MLRTILDYRRRCSSHLLPLLDGPQPVEFPRQRAQGGMLVECRRLVFGDPSFPQPAYVALFEEGSAAYMVWLRRGG